MLGSVSNVPELTVLLNRAKGGDEKAVTDVVTMIHGHVTQLVRRIRIQFPGIRHVEDTEADTSEVLLRVLLRGNNGRKFGTRAEFLNACFATIRNLLIDRLRSAERGRVAAKKRAETLQPGGDADDPVLGAEKQENVEILRVALSTLSDADYALVSLVYFEGMRQTDAFRLLDIRESTGRSRLNRIKIELARAVSDSPFMGSDSNGGLS